VAATSPELVLSHLDSLPTLPAVAVRLLQVMDLDDSTVAEIIELLQADQSLTAKILSLANSAAAGVRVPVTTLDRAVTLIGFTNIRSVILATSVFDCFGRQGPGTAQVAFDRAEFWKHALAVACAARRLAEQRPDPQVRAEDAFVAGLLHDLGKVALDAVFPKAYDRVAAQANQCRGDIADSERTVLGADHTIAGRRLAERWHLPRELQEVIWLHHLTIDALPASARNPRQIGLVQLADTMAREQRIGYSGNHVFYEWSPLLAERLRFSAADLGTVIDALGEDVAEQCALLGLNGETPHAVYVKAMTRANAELGRLNTDLVTNNRRLAMAARYFRAIIQFEQQLSDWADPSAVIVAMAEAARSALQRTRVVAFGLRDHAAAIDICWSAEPPGESGHLTRAVPLELINWLDETRGASEVLATPLPQPVRDVLGPALGATERGTPWLLPIFHQSEVAGGVAYVAETDERTRLTEGADDLRSFLASLGLALGRANAQAAAQRLSEDLAETNRRLQHMQAELARSRALSMIAEMAAGAGHELNGPLTVISGRAQMLEAKLDDPEAQRALRLIAERAHACSSIVSELMDFARPRPPQPAEFDLADAIVEVRNSVIEATKSSPSSVALQFDSTPRTGPALAPPKFVLRADREQIKTVLRELLENALEAVAANQGRITLHCVAVPQKEAIEVRIEDTGCGMTPAVLQRAFDPFFSHRSAGRGRGLGLARAYAIVEAHGGRIWLESRPDEGTTAYVWLPRSAKA
jgi:putative nucleotidyltransferase with HDIG domain